MHLYLSANSPMNSVRKGTVGGMRRIFFSAIKKVYMLSYQEGDLGKLYVSTINSRQAVAHSLNDDC